MSIPVMFNSCPNPASVAGRIELNVGFPMVMGTAAVAVSPLATTLNAPP